MKIRIWVTASVTLLALLRQATAEAPVTEYEYTPEELSFYRVGKVRQQLDRPTEIRGFSAKARSSLTPTADSMRTLAREDTVSGHVLPAGSGVTFTPQGAMLCCSPSRDTPIQGHRCKGNQATDWASSFYPDGRLRGTYLAVDETIEGVPCKATLFGTEFFKWISGSGIVYFHDNGRLARCKLAHDATVDGKSLDRGDIVILDRQGRLLRVE